MFFESRVWSSYSLTSFSCLPKTSPYDRDVDCTFGTKFTGDFPGGKISKQYLNIRYGTGAINVVGEMGYSE